MKKYVGYFDLMGYKNFIEANDTAETKRRVEHLLRDVESALGQGEYKEAASGGFTCGPERIKITMPDHF